MPSNRLPKPDTDTSANGGPQFLKAKDIGKIGSTARLVIRGNARIEDSNFGEQCIVDVTFKRELHMFAFRTNSPNYRIMYDRFGADDRKWKGPIDVEVKHFGTNDYIAIVDAAKRRAAATASRKADKAGKRKARRKK